MAQLYKDGFLEGVIFVFYKNGKILVEKRPKGNDFITSIPSGAAEEKDAEGGEYRINAMKREKR